VKLGITLPSFRESPEPALAVARAAEAAGLDGVFAYDHLFRRGAGGVRRPALELFALMGAVAAVTNRVAIGSFVARATLRPPATLANAFATVARIAGPERVVAAIGAGDGESREENESFGLGFGTVAERVATLRDAVVAVRDHGYPVWVGGSHPLVREVAVEEADGWNRWGSDVDEFAAAAAAMRADAVRSPFTPSWGGLVVLASDDEAAVAKAERLHMGRGASPGTIVGGPETVAAALSRFAAAGAEWLILGPVDSSDPENARLLGEAVLPRLHG
jgi:alkanesulfonate monooxygenase SsuD/methylene tetrahydromethanopterin reductase-like flavin-dependent oxidoreductase (luciferase family)